VRLLVTGGAGFIGSHLVDRLVAEGHEIDVVDDLSTGRLGNLAEARRDSTGSLRVHTQDVRAEEFAALLLLRQPEAVVHLASRDDAPPAMRAAVCVGGIAAVLEAARVARVDKVVTLVSGHVYGPAAARDLPLREKHAHAPTTVAGLLAQSVLGWVSAYRNVHQLDHTTLIVPSVYGNRAERGIVADLRRSLAADGRVRLTDGGRAVRDLIHIDDVVDAIVRALDRGSGVAMNIASGKGVAVRSVAEKLSVAAGIEALVESIPGEAGDIDRLVLDPGRARIHLGWAPFTDLDDGLRGLYAES
jgi:UDP-glucose 4-epimerase